MLMWTTFDIADNERAFLYRRERLEKILEPGRYRIFSFGQKLRIEKYDITSVIFEHPKIKFLFRQYRNILEPYLEVVELRDREVGMLYRDDTLFDVIAPTGLLACWKGIEKVRVDIIDISQQYEIDNTLIDLLGRGIKIASSRNVSSAICYSEVPDQHVGLLLVNGKLEKVLSSGAYGFWKYNRAITVKLLDLRLQSIDVSGQEILTRDRVSLRINLSASYKIVDAETVALKLKDYASFLYLELQLRLREAVSTNSLDELLENKDALNSVIADSAREQFRAFGIELASVGVKDIILPGDMKIILNQVVEAQKEAEANLIKRREETQAMRSLHNTAKMMENSPVLLRLKELEALERITTKIDKISVYGGLDGILNGLVNLGSSKQV